MNKSIKKIVVGMTLAACLVTLAACGNSEEKSELKGENNSNNTVTQTEETNKVSNFLNDDSSYYFMYNKVKIMAGDSMSKLNKANLDLEASYKDKTVESDDTRQCQVVNGEDTSIFNIYVYNKENSEKKASETEMAGIMIDTRAAQRDEKAADIEVYGGIKIGSSIDELEKVFGKPNERFSSDDEYVYYSDDGSKYFSFDIENNKITGITWKNLIKN